jgi:hypothetical protein
VAVAMAMKLLLLFSLKTGHTNAISEGFDSGEEIGILSMNEPNKGMNLVIFTAKRFLMNGHQM